MQTAGQPTVSSERRVGSLASDDGWVAQEFRLYFDKALSRPTPYHAGNDYLIKARDRIDRTFALIQDAVSNSSMLDVGASPFYLLTRAQAAGAARCDGIYFANDTHPMRGIPQIYSQYGAINLVHANIEVDDLPFADNSFDIITACEVLEHLEVFPERFAREIRRVLKPGGILCITVPNVSAIGNIIKLIMQRNIYYKYRSDPSGRHRHEYTGRQLRSLVNYMGLELQEAGHLPSPTSHLRWLQPAYRAIAVTPGLKHYSPVNYALGRMPTIKPTGELGAPPRDLYTDDLSIED